MTEEAAQPVVATEPVPESTPTPEPAPESLTAQPAEPLDPVSVPPEPQPASEPLPEPSIPAPEPTQAPEPAIEPEPQPVPQPVSTPEPQVIAPQPSPQATAGNAVSLVSRARELLIKARVAIQFKKRKKLEKIMGLFLKKQSITNDDVQKLLYVSDATATRYLKQLETEGRIRRQGVPGHASYSRI